MEIIKIAALSVFFIIVGMLVANNMRKSKEQANLVLKLEKQIDSIRTVRDTIIKTKYETKIKWKVRNEKEIRYIYISSDSTQLIIRDSLRSRYNQGR
jgi:hypothetical protein